MSTAILTQQSRRSERPGPSTAEAITITPQLAKTWLARGGTNRALRQYHLHKLIRAMESGAWQDLNGETIILDTDGRVLDGQHRLHAVVATNVTIRSFVVANVDPAKRPSIDTGAGRQLADYLSMHGYTQSRNLAATVTLLYLWERGEILSHKAGLHAFITHEEGLKFVEAHPGILHSVQHARRLPALMPPSQYSALDYAFHASDAALYLTWYQTMLSGLVEERYRVFLTLRERLIRDKTENVRRHVLEHFVWNIKAWNAARTGRQLHRFLWQQDEDFPLLT
jgi:hypothetical protein